jgi:hypothetical protein
MANTASCFRGFLSDTPHIVSFFFRRRLLPRFTNMYGFTQAYYYTVITPILSQIISL